MIGVHYIESAGFEKKKEINKIFITKILNIYHLYNRLHITVRQQKHTHTTRPGILITAKVLNYRGYLTICETIEYRDSIPGINDFTDLPGIAKQIRALNDAPCGRSDLSILWFTDVRGDLYSGTVAAQGSNNVPECAFANEEYMHIFRRSKSVKKFLHEPGMLVSKVNEFTICGRRLVMVVCGILRVLLTALFH